MAKIGIFDSGIGGLSVAAAVRQQLPEHDIVYLADSAYAPYGDKALELIESRAHAITQKLVALHCDIIVVACNTATVNTIDNLRNTYPVVFVGVEPGIKPAIKLSTNKRVGVLATQRTADSQRFKHFKSGFSSEAEVFVQPCPGLVEQIEALQINAVKTRELVSLFVSALITQDVDTVVLGCTHYPFIQQHIKAVVPNNIPLVNTSNAVAQQVARMVDKLSKSSKQAGLFQGITSGSTEQLARAIETLLDIAVEPLVWKD